LSANLPYLFPVSRFAHYLKAIARDKIGSFKERTDMEIWLTEWINRYVLANPAFCRRQGARQASARRGRGSGRQRRGPAGYYNARFYLRPHYQLEASTPRSGWCRLPSVKG